MKRPGLDCYLLRFLCGKEANESRMGNLMTMNSARTITGRSIIDRVRSQWFLKLILLLVLNVSIYGPYLFLQHHHFFPPTTMQLSPFDKWIPFWPWTVWLYLSIDLLMPIGPFLMTKRAQLLRYALGILLIGITADVVFLFWPTICPRPDEIGTDSLYRVLISIDNPFHAFPSLHAAFAFYSVLCGGLMFREMGRAWTWSAGLWLWAVLILLATLTTKQHVVLDLIAGSALGFVIYFCVFNERKSRLIKESSVPSVTTNLNQT